MFNSKVDLRTPTPESLAELIKNAIPQSDGTAKLIGPTILPGDRVTWLSSRYGWTEGDVREIRARRGRDRYEKGLRVKSTQIIEQVVVTGEYKYSSDRINRSTVVMHPSSLIKVNKGQSAQ